MASQARGLPYPTVVVAAKLIQPSQIEPDSASPMQPEATAFHSSCFFFFLLTRFQQLPIPDAGEVSGGVSLYFMAFVEALQLPQLGSGSDDVAGRV